MFSKNIWQFETNMEPQSLRLQQQKQSAPYQFTAGLNFEPTGMNSQRGEIVLLDQDQNTPHSIFDQKPCLQFEEFAAGMPDQMIQYPGNYHRDFNGSNSSTQDASEGVLSN